MTTTAYCTNQDCLVLPYLATTEAKAEMFADAIDVLFAPCVETEVFEDGGQWCVAVTKGMDGIDDPVDNERIVSAFILVMMFDLTERTGTLDCLADGDLNRIPAAQKALTKRARRAFRIEDKLNRILAHFEREDGIGDKLDRIYYVLIEEAEEAAEAEATEDERRLAHADD